MYMVFWSLVNLAHRNGILFIKHCDNCHNICNNNLYSVPRPQPRFWHCLYTLYCFYGVFPDSTFAVKLIKDMV